MRTPSSGAERVSGGQFLVGGDVGLGSLDLGGLRMKRIVAGGGAPSLSMAAINKIRDLVAERLLPAMDNGSSL
jgi:hypothetical protein